MDLAFSISGTIDPVAGYAALVATIVAIVEFLRWWRSGARLRVEASPNMVLMPDPRGSSRPSYVLIKVTNIGDMPTTLSTLGLYHYKKRSEKFQRKRAGAFVVKDPGNLFGISLPFILRPGEQWVGAIEQNGDLMRMAQDGLLYAVIGHSMSEREKLVRIAIPEEADER